MKNISKYIVSAKKHLRTDKKYDLSAEEIQDLAERYAEKILSLAEGNRVTIHVMGEMTLTYLVVTLLKEKGIECIASTSERYSEEIAIGRKITEFKFVRFRKY